MTAVEAYAAARDTDLVGHGFGMLGMLAGALAGAALLVGGVLTGGALFAVVVVAGSALAGGQLARGIQTATGTPDPTTGSLERGSPDVVINDLAALRVELDAAEKCHGLYTINHMLLPFVPIAEGAETVLINGREAARVRCRLMCGAKIKTGSPNVIIGGPTKRVLWIIDAEQILEIVLTGVVIGAVLVGGAAIVIEAYLVDGALVALASGLGYLGEIGVVMLGFEALGELGDQLGPGWRDILQGAAGFGALFGPARNRLGAADDAADNLAAMDELKALAKTRAEELKSTMSNKQRGPVLTMLKDKKTGQVFEGLNNPKKAAYDDLHPLIQQRLKDFHETYPKSSDWPHPDVPGRHSEIDALNQALWAREAQGMKVSEADLKDFVLYNETLYRNHNGSVPCCANCSILMGGTRTTSGKLGEFDGQ